MCCFMLEVYNTSPFDVDDEVINTFFNAPLVTIAEAVGSPIHHRKEDLVWKVQLVIKY